MRSSAWLLLCVAAAVCACDDEAPDPESVPFEGLDPAVQPKLPVVSAPEPEVSASASASAAIPTPTPRPKVVVGRLSSCCAALAGLGNTAPDPGQRNNAKAASRLCVTKLSEVRQGKLSEGAALSQVRTSILGSAPGACR